MFGFSSSGNENRATQAIQFLQVLRFQSAAESFQQTGLDDKETATRDAALDMLKDYFEQRQKDQPQGAGLLTLSQIEDYVKERLCEREKVAEQAGK